jgi:simple sugar transport system ATP-binding protein
VYELCSTVTVLRDARRVLTAPVAGLAKADLVAAMTGEEASDVADREPRRTGGADVEPLLEAQGLALEGEFEPVDFTVRPGEVLGLAGAAAGGGTALGETLVGMRTPTAGAIRVRGQAVRTGSVPHALEAGIGYIPEDRHRQGLVTGRSVAENATLTVADQLGPWGTVLPSRTRQFAASMIRSLDIKTRGPDQPVSGLSGGNQLMTLGGVPALWNQFLNGAIIIVALVISRFASGEKQD